MPRKKTVELSNKRSLAAKDFYSDYFKNGTLFAAIIRSPAASGKVKKIAVPNLPEGYFLITADDIPGSKKMETPDKIQTPGPGTSPHQSQKYPHWAAVQNKGSDWQKPHKLHSCWEKSPDPEHTAAQRRARFWRSVCCRSRLLISDY